MTMEEWEDYELAQSKIQSCYVNIEKGEEKVVYMEDCKCSFLQLM